VGDDIDGQSAWARYLRHIAARPGWSLDRIADEIGVHRSTVFRWLSDDGSSVKVGSVLDVARIAGDPPEVALRAAAGVAEPGVDAEIELINQSGLPAAKRAELIRRVLDRREREQSQRIDDIRWMIDSTRDA
jgi:transcriptional regulator with XRE-family HTH domain